MSVSVTPRLWPMPECDECGQPVGDMVTSNDDHCCDCGVSLPDPDKRHLINGGALCECCYIEREAKADARHFPWQRAVGYAPVNDDDIPF